MLRISIALCLISASLSAATYYIRTDGGSSSRCTGIVDAADPGSGTAQPCAYSDPQVAFTAMAKGDTIILRSGDTFSGAFTIASGKTGVTIKSSLIDAYPKHERITRGHPALAKLQGNSGSTTLSVGNPLRPATPTVSGTDLVFSTVNHGYTVGQRVVFANNRVLTWYCTSDLMPPFVSPRDQDCTGMTGWFQSRRNTGVALNSIVYFDSDSIPPELDANTPYYIVDLVTGGPDPTPGYSVNPERFKVSATLGGAPITLAAFDTTHPLNMQFHADPFRDGDFGYVTYSVGNTIRVSQTPTGSNVTWTQTGRVYNGSVQAAQIVVAPARGVSDITFDGLEITDNPSTPQTSVLMQVEGIGTSPEEAESRGIRFLHGWVHPHDDQTHTTLRGIGLGARDSEIGYSIIEDITHSSNDAQAIHIDSSGKVWIHDNILSASGESVMSGGTFAPYFPRMTDEFLVERNFFYKPLKWLTGTQLTVSAGNLIIRSRLGVTGCAANAANAYMIYRCHWHEGQEWPTRSWTRYDLSTDQSASISGGSGSGSAYVYGLGGVIHILHNLAVGTITLTGATVTYTAGALAFPAGSTRIGTATIASGVFSAADSSGVLQKNHLESKIGNRWIVRGNVFHRSFDQGGGQQSIFNFTVAPNGSGVGQGMNWNVSSSNSLIENNLMAFSGIGIGAIGKVFSSNASPEVFGFGRNVGNTARNNLILDVGSTEWAYQPAPGAPFNSSHSTSDWSFTNNTCLHCRSALTLATDAAVRLNYHSNVIVPYLRATDLGAANHATYVVINGDSTEGWTGGLAYNWMDAASTAFGNWLVTREGAPAVGFRPYFPSSDAGNYIQYTLAAELAVTDIFENFVTRPSLHHDGSWIYGINARLKSAVLAAHPGVVNNRQIGADIDELEALIGPMGQRVEAGKQTFAVESQRTITASTTTATLRYLPTHALAACAIKVWPNRDYSGAATVDITDTAATVDNGRRSVALTGLTTGLQYYGKRWCGTSPTMEVDVFQFRTL